LRWVLPPPLALASRSPTIGTYHDGLPTSLDGAHLAAALPPQLPALVKRAQRGTGLSTRCPSGTACACPLGPTNPPRITLAAEPSGLRWWGFAPHFTVTNSDIRTRRRSTRACAHASAHRRRSPTTAAETAVLGFGTRLGPAGFSARRHSTSELLRTISRMAASKPTYWLFWDSHILSHLATNWGP